MHSPDDFRIRVTAGTAYDPATHVQVRVNDPTPLYLQGEGGDVWLNVRIKNHKGGEGDDLRSTPYFDAEPHKTNDDTYGMGVYFIPKAEDDDKGISGSDLQWGNDFDEPLRDRLPPGFGAALRIVKWWIDPGLEGDPYADKPYLYGPALSSFNRVYAALGDVDDEQSEESSEWSEDSKYDDERSEDKKDKTENRKDDKKNNKTQEESERSEDQKEPTHLIRDDLGLWFDEGGDAGGQAYRESIGCPDADADGGGKARMKWALGTPPKAQWTWRYGQGYGLDFYNGYLDFADLTLRLPGFYLPLLRYYASEKAEKTCLRYVLRHRQTGRVYLVVVFSLVRVAKDGDNEEEADEVGDEEEVGDADIDEDKIIEDAKQKLSIHDEVDVEPSDVD
ncbi:hypothetical protein SEUCBS139899_008951 [Sporothrix eucalyptigena]|uniref:Domain of unknown function at the cortex 1 domain-containing protein n=1 Tax=Sporothrix eucalyptigena TaxID=1812306 RepID=A0ABP0C0F8_9PEZI